MKKLFWIVSVVYGLVCGWIYASNNENKSTDIIHKYTLDDFIRVHPEIVPETVWVNVRLPKVELDNEIVNAIMALDLTPKLRNYKQRGKIIVSLANYPFGVFNTDRIYEFRPVTPIEPTSLKVKGNKLPDIIAYLQYDDIYVLLTDSFKNQIIYSDTTLHDFKLKLVKQSIDLTCYWEYIVNDSIIKRPQNPDDINYEYWQPEIIKMFNTMDQHNF